MLELLTVAKKIKEQRNQISEAIALLCEKISENEDEVAYEHIGKIMRAQKRRMRSKKSSKWKV